MKKYKVFAGIAILIGVVILSGKISRHHDASFLPSITNQQIDYQISDDGQLLNYRAKGSTQWKMLTEIPHESDRTFEWIFEGLWPNRRIVQVISTPNSAVILLFVKRYIKHSNYGCGDDHCATTTRYKELYLYNLHTQIATRIPSGTYSTNYNENQFLGFSNNKKYMFSAKCNGLCDSAIGFTDYYMTNLETAEITLAVKINQNDNKALFPDIYYPDLEPKDRFDLKTALSDLVSSPIITLK